MTQALNMLPVGQIDGGQVTQTGFGRRALGLTSLGVYVGLSLGLIRVEPEPVVGAVRAHLPADARVFAPGRRDGG